VTANVAILALAAFFESAGGFVFWMWLRLYATPLVALLGIGASTDTTPKWLNAWDTWESLPLTVSRSASRACSE
jgi:hypothetical protein